MAAPSKVKWLLRKRRPILTESDELLTILEPVFDACKKQIAHFDGCGSVQADLAMALSSSPSMRTIIFPNRNYWSGGDLWLQK